jgi:prephenate dehydratase
MQREENVPELSDVNKASVSFHTDHSKGSLAKVLTKIAEAGINLSKLQSFPIPGSDWQYSFHADMEFEALQDFEKAIKKIQPFTEEVKVYGVYKKGITI